MSGTYQQLSTSVIADLTGVLKDLEGWNPDSTDNGIYDDNPVEDGTSKHYATLGYGLNIASKDGTSLSLVLNAVTGTVNGQTMNVFQVAAANAVAAQATNPSVVIPTVQTIVNYFEWIVHSNPLNGTDENVSQLQGQLDLALQDFFSGHNPIMTSNPPQAPFATTVPANTSAPAFELTKAQAEPIIAQYINGVNIVEGAAGTLAVQSVSATIYNTLVGLGVPAANIPSPDSAQWEAIVSYAYNGFGKTRSHQLASALESGNQAEVWYVLRYYSNSSHSRGVAKRNDLQSQMYGLGTSSDTLAQAEQAYEVLTDHRYSIIAYEQALGTDPDGTNPLAAANAISLANRDIASIAANATATSTLPNSLAGGVDTLTEAFGVEAGVLLSSLVPAYSGLLPVISVDSPQDTDTSTAPFSIRSTDIFVADPNYVDVAENSTETLDAYTGDPGPNSLWEADSNHILIGMADNESLIGGRGNDILIAGSGNETLVAGLVSDTLIGGQGMSGTGNDTLVESAHPGSTDSFVFATPTTGSSTETIDASALGDGVVIVYTAGRVTQLGAAANGTLKLVLGQQKTWTDGTLQYHFQSGQGPDPSIGTLQITGMGAGDEIDIQNFDLQKATDSPSGFLGIHLQKLVSITPGSNAGVDPPAPDFIAGSSQTYTIWVNAPSDVAQTVAVTLTGASASDFGLDVGSGIDPLNSDGTFTVTIPAGDTNASFALVNTGDVGGNAAIQLTATLSDPNDPDAGTVTSDPITQNYVEPGDDPFTDPQPTEAVSGSVQTDPTTGTQYTLYQGDGGNDSIATGSGLNAVDLGSGSDLVNDAGGGAVIAGGVSTTRNSSGNLTLVGDSGGNGNNVIILNDNADVVTAGSGDNKIYGNTEIDIATAVTQANSDAGSGNKGAFLSAGDGDNTITGGDGNDLMMVGTGQNILVLGPGADTVLGGVEALSASADWSTSTDGNHILTNDVSWQTDGSTAPAGVAYEGNSDLITGNPFGSGNDTIFGGSGDAAIYLSNGDNAVELGTGNSTVLGGMGDNTIVGGGGDNYVAGGGGSDYITAGNGDSALEGEAGNNTLIGGAGTDTLVAGDGSSAWATAETGNNYVQAGSGATLIFGSGGNDTLLGGTGSDTIEAGAGNEYVDGGSGADSIYGGSGNDTLSTGSGNDVVWAGSGDTTIYGGDGSDSLYGGSGTNVIYAGDGGTDSAATYAIAGSGDTTLYGGDGGDYLGGGAGNDVIYAGDGGDSVFATTVVVGSGNTTVYGGDGVDIIEGGSGTDVLYAGDGGVEGDASAVTAGSGVTTLYGGAGVSVLTDSAGGSDQLIGGEGTTSMHGIGNDTFIAGTGMEYLSGTGSNTYVFNSGGGEDEVVNAGGTETLDFSYDSDPTDDVTLGAVAVSDGTVALEISDGATDVLVDGGLTGANVASVIFGNSQTESLASLVQAADAAGNAYDTAIAGTNGYLDFDTGDGDSLAGGTGQDTLSAWGNNDTLTAGANGSAMYSQGDQAQVTGSATGADTLSASGPDSTLIGGYGYETFEVNDTSDVVEAQAGAESNSLLTSVNYVLPTYVDEATLTGSGNLFVQGNNDAANVITGNSGDDTLVAGRGSDTLIAGAGADELFGSYGDDEFVVNSSSDEVFTNGYGYADTIESSVSYTVTASEFVSTLILTGTANLTATDADGYVSITGNAGNDTLTGGSGSDTLVAGSGVDTLISGSGYNTLVVDNAADVIELSPGAAGKDTLESSVSETLMGGLDNLVLTGSDNLVGQGNDDASDAITGNTGDDTLIAGSGDDELVAGGGNDTLIAGAGSDTLEGSTSGGNDTFVLNAGSESTLIDLPTTGAATIQFGMGITAADLSVGVVNNSGDLQLQITEGSSVLTLDDGSQGQFGFVTDSGLNFSFADGSTLTLGQLLTTAQVQSTTIAGAYGNLVLDSADDTSLTGGFGDDTLIASGSDDTIVAGAGTQLLVGYGSGDVLAAGSGDDTLVGGVNSTLVTGSGNSVIYGGAQNNTYVLTEGTSTTIYASSASAGVQTLLLPPGMTEADFTSFLAPNGDLIIQSTDGDTSAVIKGYASNGSAAVWFIADQNGDDGQLLDSWVASNSGSSSGGSQPSSYQQEVAGLMSQYKVYLQDTLEQFGSSNLTLGYPYDPSSSPAQNTEYYQYTFTGLNTENLTVQGGSLSVGASQNSTSKTQTTQTGTETVSYTVPIYETVTNPGYTLYLPPQDGDTVVVSLSDDGETPQGDYSNGQLTGYSLYVPPYQETIQTGVQTESYTVPVYTYYTTATMGLTLYNITGDGGSDVINAASSFVGTVVTGDGNDVNVDLGINTAPINGYYGYSYSYPEVMSPGAFIDVGNGINDTIAGTGGADAVAAGLGFDNILVGEGSTVYVPMEGTSTEIINYFQNEQYGSGPFPLNTLVLPEGITPQDLQFKLFIVPGVDPTSPDAWQSSYEAIQITYGDSTVLAYFYPQNAPYSVQNAAPNSIGGTNYFEFSDGTVLTRAQILAMAGPAQVMSLHGPTVTPLAINVAAETTVSAADLFSASADANGAVRLYQITNSAGSGAYFVLNGTVYTPGQTFQIGADQLSQLQYVSGTAGSGDSISVAAFDGINLGNTTTFPLWVPTPATAPGQFVANGPNESVVGTSTGPDTITGGYGGDALVGTSGEDIFTYSAGSGAETVTEDAPTGASSSNVVQFGGGITASSMTASLAANGGLVLSTGTPGDSLTIEGFAPLDPLNSMPIQQFQFADGTSLTFAQLLSQVQSSGTEQDVTNPDGTTTAYAFDLGSGSIYYARTLNANSQPVLDYYLNADGSTRTDSFSYYGTEAYDTQVRTAASGATTTLSNNYEPSSGGSYTDYWSSSDSSDGSYSYGNYWWNASTYEYRESWTDTNGTTWTDDYQYASGGSPGSTGVSFTETYSDSSGDQGTRQYNASTGVTSVTWYSAAAGTTTTGTVSDSGFIGLQNDGVLTNNQSDPTFFNPASSPAFQNFLSGH